MAEGGVVYGVSFGEEWCIEHVRVEDAEGLAQLRGSKYAYSRFAHVLPMIERDLDEGRKVLFSGTPCQVAAVHKRFGQHDNLLLVEIVCHGAPEQKYWTQYIKEICAKRNISIEDITRISFRDKCTGWKNYSFTVKFSDGSVFSQPHDDNLYMRAFLKDLTLREACFRCPFKYPGGTKADITLGDLWGITQLAPEIDNDLGTTLIIARTAKGEDYASCLSQDAQLTYEGVTRYNPAIVRSATRPVDFDVFRSDAEKGLLRAMNHYASRPLRETIYLRLARFKHRLLHK